MKKRLLTILAGAMLATSVLAGDAFDYKLMFGDTSAVDTPYAFGRIDGATNKLDDFDVPAPPATPDDPNGGTMQYIAFRSIMGTNGASTADEALQKLTNDYRGTGNAATTWTMDLSNPSGASLNWEAETALTASGASLQLIAPDGTTVDMKKNTTIASPASGTYYIKYKQSSSVQEAPETPALIEADMAIYEGGSISFKVLDPAKFEFAGTPVCTIAFFKGEGIERVRVPAGETDGLSADSETGCITYAFDTALDYDEAVITYCFRKKSGTRAENTAVAYGQVRAVDVAKPVITMTSDATLKVDIKSEEPSANMCVLSYDLIFPGAGDNGRLIDGTNTLVLYPTITVPAMFTVTPPEGMGEDNRTVNADGSISITYSYEATSNGFTLDFILTAEEGAKKGTASLAIACQFPTTQAVNLPEDIATTTATISVKGGANLDIDGSHNGARYVLQDVRLLYNYINRGNSDDTRMLAGTTFKTLTGDEKAAKAAELREKIADMIDSLDIDDSHAGSRYVLQDVRLIYNYINRGNSDDTRMLAGTTFKTLTGDAKAAKAAEIREKIAAMIE